ncbi:MAG TPA: PGPGW domain-containing protein [Rubricoccaceae bacterium]|jgi:hypothetical protein
MFERLKRQWHDLKEAKPGHRFQDQYERKQKAGRSTARKGAIVAAGIVVLAAGVFLLPAPGPGFIVVALGAAMVAQESLAAARMADTTEVWLRGLAAWGIRLWRGSTGGGKGLIVLVALTLAGLAAWAAYYLVFGR